ncbi:MAG: TVP38/TMEM64 family protein [Gammaproteobacteria bacterium]|nr:TVP38/TMEM64 family protein [Gammaproteobacteria bacterium]
MIAKKQPRTRTQANKHSQLDSPLPDRHTELFRLATNIKFAIFSLLIVLALGVIFVSVLALGQGLSVQYLEELIQSWGMWGVLTSIGLMILHSFVPFPAEFIALANGMLFGPVWGTVVTWIGAMLGASLAFALARALGRPFVAGIVAKKNWHQLDEWGGRQGVYVILTLRLVPVIAFNLINYAAGLTRMSWWTFLWTTGLGILPLTIAMVLMGDSLDRIAWHVWALLLLGVAVLWIVMVRLRRRAVASAAD